MRSARWPFAVLWSWFFLGSFGFVSAADEAPTLAQGPRPPEAIREHFQDQDYDAALQALAQAAETPDAPRGLLDYFKGRALQLAGRHDEAIAAYQAVERDHAESPWAVKARLGRAVTFARKGDFRSAELIYRDEAAYLLSDDRKQELADIYLEFARAYFKPPQPDQTPDYAKALEFFGKALEVGPKSDVRREIELRMAECYQHLGNLEEAARRYAAFTKEHPTSPLDLEARFRLGEVQLDQGDTAEARRTWQDLLAAYPANKSERVAEAKFNLAVTYGMPRPGALEDLDLGAAALEAFLEQYPNHALTSRAHLWIAEGHAHRGRYEDAVEALARYLGDERYAERDETPAARNLLGRCYQLQKRFDEAIAAWRDYLAKHPTHSAWSSVQAEIVNTEYLIGAEALRAKQYDEARRLWTEFIASHPLDERNPAILFQFGLMHYHQEQWDQALADWRRLTAKHPQTEESSRAQFMIAATLEEKLNRLDEALEEYRKLDWGSYAGQARQRIARLTTKSLTIETARVFRGDETPAVRLTTRNIEGVTVRAYRVDLETYFRKMHLARGVESLDVSLIDPDQSFEFEIPDYAEHAQLVNEIPLPLGEVDGQPGAGVLAVTVSSKTLEATTLVMQSDLDMIVKSSRDELFVFAQNMRTGQPWPGARLLISDGAAVLAEAETGEDGVFQKAYDELKQSDDVRVFAVSDGHTASNVVDLSGVGLAQGLTDKGYLYTDRPAYRAGQMVHVRGVVRRAEGDAYQLDAGEVYTLDVFDSRNRLLRSDRMTLGEFGSFHHHFALSATSAEGQYRLLLKDEEEQGNYQGSFTVHSRRLEPIQLVIDVERKVFYRGEEIEGVIRAEYYHGAPLAGRTVRYRLADDRFHEGVTDAKGEVHFGLATRDYRESQVLPLTAALPERDVHAATNFFLAAQGFSITVETPRAVYVAGETFETTVTTRDAEGEPIGRKLVVDVLEQTNVDGRVGERSVEKHELTSDDKTGMARLTLRLDEGARYVLRVEGIDRFQNPISGEHIVQVSDDSDQVRLRILADRHSYRVGDEGRVRLHWREAPALALVTFQGARILDYRLVRLETGENELTLPMTAALAPNFELAAAVMTDARPAPDAEKPIVRFHQAASPFTVERELNLAVAYRRADGGQGPARPGEDVEVTVTATDPQGRPASAEISLALVEQALLARFAAPAGAIGDFFRAQPRTSAVRTTSSIDFSYHPQTRPINARLLAETDRHEIAADEAARRAVVSESLATHPAAAPAYDFETRLELLTDVMATETWAVNGAEADGEAQLGVNLQLSAPQQAADRAVNGGQGGGGAYAGSGLAPSSSAYGAVHEQQLGERMGRRASSTRAVDGPVESFFAKRPQDVRRMLGQEVDAFTVLSRGGEARYLSRGRLDESGKAIEHYVDELSRAGAVLYANDVWQETAYWNPTIATDAAGKAVLTLTLPDRSTGWRFVAKGVTQDTLAGDAELDLAVKKTLFGELKLPAAFTDGDRADVLATVHNDLIEGDAIEVTLKTTIGGRSVEQTKTIAAADKGMHELSFPAVLARPEETAVEAGASLEIVFELSIKAGDEHDVLRRVVPLLPDGMPIFAAASGSAAADATAWVEPPAEMPLTAPSLEIIIGPTVERSLLDVVLGSTPRALLECAPTATLDTATSDLMAALAARKLFAASRDADDPRAQDLEARIRSSISLLVSAQRDDGGWSWTGAGEASHRYSSARAAWALSLARQAAYPVPDEVYQRALNYLQDAVVATSENDYESKAILLHALTTAGRGDFTLANRLYRNRTSLSSGALAYLALTFAAMDRKGVAEELLGMLAGRDLDDARSRRQAAGGTLPWSHSPAELRAVYALASQIVEPESAATRSLIDWLMAHRTGHRWSPDKATGPAALAVGEWYARTRFAGEHYQLAVFVNDSRVALLDVDEHATTQTINVPAELLGDEGKQRINFQLTGRGRYTYQCVLGGFVPADKLKSTTDAVRIVRYHEQAPLEVDGRDVPRGFDVVAQSYSWFRNLLTELPVGGRGRVEVRVGRTNLSTNVPEEQLEYLVVTEPLPSGVTVVESSITGGFERYEITPGAVRFFIGGSWRNLTPISFEVHGYLPGEYRAGPAVVRNVYRPQELAVTSAAALTVSPLGSENSDEYRLTPDEQFALGKHYFERGAYEKAGEQLGKLFADWTLRPEPHKEAARMLLDIHLAAGPDHEIVRYFEIIKEKWPELEFSFEKITRIGAAYHEIGEYERSYMVFRATLENSFLRESNVGAFLESQGEFVRGVQTMQRLIGEYPPEPYLAAARYALAQRVYAAAPDASQDPKLRERKITRIDLIHQAVVMLDDFLTMHPHDPAADQASFSLATALVELETFDEVIRRAGRFAERYPQSDYLDSYWYVIGYANFALGRHAEALAMCRKVAEAMVVDPASGREAESRNKWRSIYIMGQVHHSLGEAAEAIREYERVEDRFPDARQAIDFFAHQMIRLPEVVTVRPGEATDVGLAFRNVARCEAKVYRIDLMKFGLLNRNLAGITEINLAGIRPYHELGLELGDGQDYRDREATLSLPLEEEGAYLVVCRAENLYTSGLVLVSPLEVQVREESTSGRVRATVKNADADRFMHDVHVKVIGSDNADFTSGETDLRGVFVADAVRGTATVIAQAASGAYAFFRGETYLGAPRGEDASEPAAEEGKSLGERESGEQLLEDLYEGNRAIQLEQREWFDKNIYQQQRKGVQAREAF